MNRLYLFTFLLVALLCACTTDIEKPSIQEPEKIEKRSQLQKMGEETQFGFNVTISVEDFNTLIDDPYSEITDLDIIAKDGSIWLQGTGDLVLYEYELTRGGGDLTANLDGERTVSCSGCTTIGPGSQDHCVPEKDENGKCCHCTECPNGQCTKTVTVKADSV